MKIPWYVIFLIGFVAGFLAFWKGCERDTKVITKTDTVRVVDTIYMTKVIPQKIVNIPVPSGIQIPLTPAPPDLDLMRTYNDSVDIVKDFRLYYDITTRGILTGLEFSALDTRPIIKETITIREKAKPNRGVYVGLGIGGSPEAFNNISGSLDYVNNKNIYGYHYNIIDGSHNVRIGRRLF